jgi:CubicO group peptidase (beta-lactamase class C family)
MALSHLTGLQREPPGEIWESMEPPSREELIAGLEDAELVLRPAEQWHYSNLVYALLGEIVMRTGGAPYEELLQKRILDPLELRRTSLRPDEPKASPYYVDPFDDTVHDEPDPEVTDTTAAAGWLWSTAADLARWGTFLADGHEGVLPKATLDLMSRVRTMADERTWSMGWGLGLELLRRGERVFVGHGGAMPGFLAGLVVDRADRTGAAVLMNTSANADPIALSLDLLVAALEGAPRTPPLWVPGPAPPAELDGMLGSWWTEGEEIILSLRGGRFQAELRGGVPGRTISFFEPIGVDRWRVVEGRERGEVLRAVRDESNTIVKLYFATYPLTRTPTPFG